MAGDNNMSEYSYDFLEISKICADALKSIIGDEMAVAVFP